MQKASYFVVVPAHNEGAVLEKFLKKLSQYTRQFIVVDDGSRDETKKIAQKYTPFVLRHEINLGKGAAMTTGCEFAFNHLKADGVIFMDGDGQHDPKELKLFIQKLKARHLLVFGVRELSAAMPKERIWANKFFSLVMLAFFGKYVPDILSGYKAVSKAGYKKIKWWANGYDVEAEIVARTTKFGLKYDTVSITTIYNELDRGMTIVDALNIAPKLLEWKLFI